MIEQKLDLLRNLLVAAVGLIVILGAIVVYQGQTISRNRDTVVQMQRDAQTAIGQFMPTLEQRLDLFEERIDVIQGAMDGIDVRIKEAEDRFVRRMEQEFPTMMDGYFEVKFEELRRLIPNPGQN